MYRVHFEPVSTRFLHRPTGQFWLRTPGETPSMCGRECSGAWSRLCPMRCRARCSRHAVQLVGSFSELVKNNDQFHGERAPACAASRGGRRLHATLPRVAPTETNPPIPRLFYRPAGPPRNLQRGVRSVSGPLAYSQTEIDMNWYRPDRGFYDLRNCIPVHWAKSVYHGARP